MTERSIKSLYIALIKKVIINEIYIENEMKIFYLVSGLLFGTGVDLGYLVHPERIPGGLPENIRKSKLNGSSLSMVHPNNKNNVDTRNFTEFPHSMIGRKRMDNIEYCVERILEENIEGDFLEAGVWRGGAVIFMKALLFANDNKTRKVFVADSFEGVPEPTDINDKLDISRKTMPFLAVSMEEVKELFARYELLDENVVFLKGWFKDSLPKAPVEKLALLRADGDLYESTMDILKNLYHKVSPGGFIIIDDYNEPNLACKKAVDDFRNENKISAPLIKIDEMSVYWRKE